MARKLGRGNVVEAIKFFEMQGEPVTGTYEKTEVIKSDKLTKGEATFHTFSKIGDETKKFGIWGFGGLDYALKDAEVGMPLRLTYNGKKPAQIQIGKKKVNKDIHDVTVEDITEDLENGNVEV